METIENTESTSNGTVVPPTKVKPWIAAGFPNRDAWRASKGQKTAKPKTKAAKPEVTAAAAKPAVKKTKKKAKAKVKAAAKKPAVKKTKKLPKKSVKLAAKGKDKKTKAKKKGPGVKDNSLKPVPVAELSARCKKVFLAVPKGGTMTLESIQDKAFPNLSHKQGSSWTRNQLRFLRVHRMMKMLGGGKYKRLV